MPNELLTNSANVRRLRGRATRSTSVGTKLTQAEFAQVEAASKAEGKAVGEWLRDAALNAIHIETSSGRCDFVLAEVIGVRLLLVNVLRSVAAGQTISPEAFDKLLDEIGNAKYRLAEKLVSEGRK